jgi:hypothetical protein
LLQIDTNSLDDALHDISSACMRGVQVLPTNAVSQCVREEVRVLAATIHVAKGLKSSNLVERHWRRIRALVPKLLLGCSSGNLCFGDLRTLGVIDAQDRFEAQCSQLFLDVSVWRITALEPKGFSLTDVIVAYCN